jgi:hypothetical protein
METQSTIEPFRCCTPALVTTVLVDVEVLPGPSFPTISDSCLQQQCHHHIHHKILLYKPIKRQLWWWGLVLERLAQMESAKPIKSYTALKKGARPEHKLQ